ncbi:MAG: YwaF family protein [Clostridia bacterium]|nr:YwaF family protein [Clostridia bacterium]
MFFAKPGRYKACGLFGIGHLILLFTTVLSIVISVKRTKIEKKEEIKNIIGKATIIIWVLEIIKIIFNLLIGNKDNINTYIPLYYCSILLYAGIFSSICKGKLQRMGDVFIATGGIIGGIVFLIFPTTSIANYPMFHFISLQSFLFHGIMIYLGIIVNKYDYIEIENKDIVYYGGFILIICIISYIVNCIYGSNLMFISQDFPQNPITIIYKLTGKFYPIVMTAIQMILPFYVMVPIIRKLKKNRAKSLYQNLSYEE